MKNFVLFTAVLEILAGIILFCMPQMLPTLADVSGAGLTMARMYGAAALAVGYFALKVWQNFGSHDLKRGFLNTFIVFHVGVAIAIFIGYNVGGVNEFAPGVLHTVMALITIYFYMK